MSLEPLKKSLNIKKYSGFLNQQDLLKKIAKIVYDISSIECGIKISSYNKLYLTTNSSSASSDLRFCVVEIEKKVNEYLISQEKKPISTVIIKIN